MTFKARRLLTGGVVVATFAYYVFVAPWIALTVLDPLVTSLGIQPGPDLAALTLVAEFTLAVLPFALATIAARRVPTELQSWRLWAAPAIALSLVVLVDIAPHLLGAGGFDYSGITATLGSSFALGPDVLALLVGIAIVNDAARRTAPEMTPITHV